MNFFGFSGLLGGRIFAFFDIDGSGFYSRVDFVENDTDGLYFLAGGAVTSTSAPEFGVGGVGVGDFVVRGGGGYVGEAGVFGDVVDPVRVGERDRELRCVGGAAWGFFD